MSVTFVWSESELLKHPEYYPGIEEKELPKLGRILWTLGMDVKNHKITVDVGVKHRNRFDNSIVECKRFVGIERTDPEWRQSGYCSLEALIASSGDKGFRKELCSMASVPKMA